MYDIPGWGLTVKGKEMTKMGVARAFLNLKNAILKQRQMRATVTFNDGKTLSSNSNRILSPTNRF